MKACKLNEVVGFDEMTGFKPSDNGNVLQSEFSSGVRVTLRPAENVYRIDGPRSVATRGNVRLPG